MSGYKPNRKVDVSRIQAFLAHDQTRVHEASFGSVFSGSS